MCCVLFVVLCIVCCVSQYCVVQMQKNANANAKKCQKNFKGNYLTTMYFVLCIVCCVSPDHSTVLCQQSNANFFQQHLFIFHKNIKIYFVLIIKCFFECCRFLNVCMKCSVDVTESGGAAACLVPLRHHSAGRIEPSFRRPLAPMGMSCNQS